MVSHHTVSPGPQVAVLNVCLTDMCLTNMLCTNVRSMSMLGTRSKPVSTRANFRQPSGVTDQDRCMISIVTQFVYTDYYSTRSQKCTDMGNVIRESTNYQRVTKRMATRAKCTTNPDSRHYNLGKLVKLTFRKLIFTP